MSDSLAAIFLMITTMLLATLASAAPQTAVLYVHNMTCDLCPVTVRKSLEKVPGVSRAKIDFEKKTATVVFDSDRTSAAALVNATTEAGYPSTEHK